MQRLFSLLHSLALLIPCGCGQSLPAANASQDPPAAVAVPEDIPAPPEAPAELPAEPSEPEPPAPTTATLAVFGDAMSHMPLTNDANN